MYDSNYNLHVTLYFKFSQKKENAKLCAYSI